MVERLPKSDADILDGVVRAGLEIAVRGDLEAEAPVAREQVKHVIEEADAGRDRRVAAAVVELKRQANLRFLGCSLNAGGATHVSPIFPGAPVGRVEPRLTRTDSA